LDDGRRRIALLKGNGDDSAAGGFYFLPTDDLGPGLRELLVIDPRRYRMTEHTVAVPLDHARPDGETIDVFARELCDVEKVGEDLPWLLFLQGGPGGASPRPSHPDAWIRAALASYRLLLLDQRGTGRSTPVLAQTADRFPTPTALADYLAHFRADAIVGDAEILRQEVCHGAQWSTLGQSYG
jgi:pimeloyl-ACP methyl ester carboxylesterase